MEACAHSERTVWDEGDESLCVLGLPFRRRSSANPEDGWVQHREVSDADRACLDDKLRFFGWKWAGFWAWLDVVDPTAKAIEMPSNIEGLLMVLTEDLPF